jgi:hypothetical protein
MNEKEILRQLIDEPKKPNVYEWAHNVDAFLEDTNVTDTEAWTLIDTIKKHGDCFGRCENLIALLKHLYKRKYDGITLPPITKRNQVFVAMKFSTETDSTYTNVYKPVIQQMDYSAMRIDEKEYNGSIISEITTEIANSVAIIADLTGNRGGVYYEAGVARGLQLCNHPIQLVFTCNHNFFETDGVHFDVKGDNIILYKDETDLHTKLRTRLETVLVKGTKV